ncbi:hypothetical protein FRC20_003527, partial [Serendipita sp. 405]
MYSKLFAVGLLTLCAYVAATPIPAAELAIRGHLDVRIDNTVNGGELPGSTKRRAVVQGGDLPSAVKKRTDSDGGDLPGPGRKKREVEVAG